MVIILMITAVISFVTGSRESTIVILAVLVMNAVLGTVQHFKAEKSLQSLQAMAAPTAQTAAAIHAVAGAERTSSRRPEMRLASTPPMVVMLKARLCPLAASS